jgi:hypothetical protein
VSKSKAVVHHALQIVLGKSPLNTSFGGYSQSFRAFEGFLRWELRPQDTGSGGGNRDRRWDTGWGQLYIESHISAITRSVHDRHGFCTLDIKMGSLIAGIGPSLGAG